MTDLEKEINDISGLRNAVPMNNFDRDEFEYKLENLLNTDKEVKKAIKIAHDHAGNSIHVPDFFEYIRLYAKQMFYYTVAMEDNPRKLTNDFHKDLYKFLEFLAVDSGHEIDWITFKAKNGDYEKFTSKMFVDSVIQMLKDRANMMGAPAMMAILGKPGNSPKIGTYNKDFIRSLYPLFRAAKKHNPTVSDVEIYKDLITLIEALGFDFDKEYPDSREEDPFKTYFKDLK